MSNWKTQARDAQGRFLSKVEVAVPTPVVKKRVSKKAKETVIPQQFNCYYSKFILLMVLVLLQLTQHPQLLVVHISLRYYLYFLLKQMINSFI